MGYSPWGRKELDMTEATQHACTIPLECYYALWFPPYDLVFLCHSHIAGYLVLFLRILCITRKCCSEHPCTCLPVQSREESLWDTT